MEIGFEKILYFKIKPGKFKKSLYKACKKNISILHKFGFHLNYKPFLNKI